jgi:sepiapterin reductase
MDWSKKTFLLVSGASKGIGRTIAVEFSKKLAAGSKLALLARSAQGLEETKGLCNSALQIETFSVDLVNPDTQALSAFVKKAVGEDDYEVAMVVHNAGSIGNLKRTAKDLENLAEVNDYFHLNVSSLILLNSLFLKAFPDAAKCKRMVVNITSLCGIKPFHSFALYCSGKATREMFLKVLAMEEPTVRVLNYSPGPVLTDMADEILDGLESHELRKPFEDMRNSGGYLTTEHTVGKLIQLLESDNYQSGDHVDVFDF